jgi:hypothetical protein
MNHENNQLNASRTCSSQRNSRHTALAMRATICAAAFALTGCAVHQKSTHTAPGISDVVDPAPDTIGTASAPGRKEGLSIGVKYTSETVIPRDQFHVSLDGDDVTDKCVLNRATMICDINAYLPPGRHPISVVIGEMRKSWSYETAPPPQIFALFPAGVTHYELSDQPVVLAKFCNTHALQRGELSLLFDAIDVTAKAVLHMTDDRCGELRFTPHIPLAPGDHEVEMEIHGAHELVATKSTVFRIIPPAEYKVEILSPPQGAILHEADVNVEVAMSSNRSSPNVVIVNDVIASARSYIARPVVFDAQVRLEPGTNELNIRASFRDGETRVLHAHILYDGDAKK